MFGMVDMILVPHVNRPSHVVTLLLSWNYRQDVNKILQHFGFVADFLKIVCWFKTFDNFLCLSHVLTLCCSH